MGAATRKPKKTRPAARPEKPISREPTRFDPRVRNFSELGLLGRPDRIVVKLFAMIEIVDRGIMDPIAASMHPVVWIPDPVVSIVIVKVSIGVSIVSGNETMA